MDNTNAPQKGIFGIDILPGIDLQDFLPDNLESLLPGPVGSAIKENVGKILDPNDGSVSVGSPQPDGERPIPVDADSQELSTAVKVIDTLTAALTLVLKLGFLVPEDTKSVVRNLIDALGTVRGWLD